MMSMSSVLNTERGVPMGFTTQAQVSSLKLLPYNFVLVFHPSGIALSTMIMYETLMSALS